MCIVCCSLLLYGQFNDSGSVSFLQELSKDFLFLVFLDIYEIIHVSFVFDVSQVLIKLTREFFSSIRKSSNITHVLCFVFDVSNNITGKCACVTFYL